MTLDWTLSKDTPVKGHFYFIGIPQLIRQLCEESRNYGCARCPHQQTPAGLRSVGAGNENRRSQENRH